MYITSTTIIRRKLAVKTVMKQFVPSFLLTFYNSNEDIGFDITKNLPQSHFQNNEPESACVILPILISNLLSAEVVISRLR